MNLTRDDWSAVLRLLDEALDLPALRRDAWLAALDPRHQHLQPALRQLLDERRAIETDDFLGELPPLPPSLPDVGLAQGRRIGPYVLLRELGRGGMASVWLAVRADGAHGREVALKLPYLGARARVLGERFARERQILSALTHPHIASVLDAGSDGEQPWLAMEYVAGQPLTDWAAQHLLDVPARLRLFLQVLQAVQHAHAQLVIHRDLKPGNVLVDAHGQVKLLDFGVAKLLGEDGATADTELTQIGGRALTPQYASPEQVAGRSLGTASDVYAMGVLLHELLTGRLPYTLKRATPAALEEAILAATIHLPSEATSDLAVRRALRGDLDTIVGKALALKPGDRYGSAEAFAQDIERHLQSQPILARPATAGYRLRKWLARHKLAFAAGAAVTLAVLGGAAVAVWQAQLAQREARRAEAVQRFLTSTLSLNDPDQARGRDMSARELLDLSARQIDTQFASDPATQAQLHHTVGTLYVAMGAIEQARPHIERAVELYESTGQRGSRRHIEALFTRSEVFDELSDFDAAREATVRTQREAERAFGPRHAWSGRLLANLAWFDLHQGRIATAKEQAEKALGLQLSLTGENSLDYLAIAVALAHVYLNSGEPRRARELFERCRRIGGSLPDYPDGDRLMDRYNLARTRFVLSDFAGLEVELRDLAPRMDKHFGTTHDRTLVAWSLLAQTLAHQGHFDEGIALQRTTLERARSRGIADDETVAAQTLVMALLLNLAARYEQAVVPARAGLAHFDAKYAQPTTYRERGRWIVGESLLGLGDASAGTAVLRTALANANILSPDGKSLATAPTVLSLAVAERRADALGATCTSYEDSTGPDSRSSLRCRAIEAWLQALAAPPEQRPAALGRFVAARERLLAGLPEIHGLRAELIAAEAEILQASDAPRAAALQAQAGASYRRTFGREMPPKLWVLH